MEHTDPPDDYDDHYKYRDNVFIDNKLLPYFLIFPAVYDTKTTLYLYLFSYFIGISLYEKRAFHLLHLFRGPPYMLIYLNDIS